MRVAVSQRQRGFTLVELIITIVILSALSIVGSSIFSDTFRTSRMVNASQSSADEVRYALERLAREIREVKYVDDPATPYYDIDFSKTNLTKMVFVNGGDVTVTIAQTVNQAGDKFLTLGYASADGTTLASQVTAFSLKYLALDGAATTTKSDVRFVVISLAVKDKDSGQTMTQQTRVTLRNA